MAITAPHGDGTSTTGRAASRWRRVAFRGVSVGVVVVVLLVFLGGLAEMVLRWLSDATLLSLIDDLAPADLQYRGQFIHVGVVAWAIVPPLVVQLRTPSRRVAPMLQALAVAIASVVVFPLAGAPELLDVAVLAAVGLMAWLHPCAGELVRRPRLYDRQARIIAVGAVPWLAMAWFNLFEARDAATSDSIADVPPRVLWGHSALVPVVIVLVALVGSTDHGGWRLPAWTATVAAVVVGVHALAYPAQAASLSAPWAVAAIAWGLAFAMATVHRSRRAEAA